MERLSQMKARHKTIPIMLADSLLPGQQVRLGSDEEKFQRLVETIQEEQQGELGMIGFHPLTGNPLSIGVTCTLEHVFHYGDHCSIGVHASKSFEVQGEPYLDETESFYLADIELVDERPEPALNAEEFRSAQRRHDEIPGMVETWKGLILEKKRASVKELAEILEGLGADLPTTMKERSIWVASLVNPLPRLEESVCMEVRPAMLACRNDYDRVNLAWTSLTYSIDHLRGKGERRGAF